jgi:hypothetical protein
LPYRNVDSNDYWSYDPADAKTYNLVQPYHRSTSTWRTSEGERLGAHPTQYKYAGIIAYNLPFGTVWNSVRAQWEASNPANTAKGGRDLPACQRHRSNCGMRVAVRILDVEGFEVDGPCEAAEDRDGADVSDHRGLAA